MKFFDRFRSSPKTFSEASLLTHSFDAGGISIRLRNGNFAATGSDFLDEVHSQNGDASDCVFAAYLAQLSEDGKCFFNSTGCVIPWHNVYALIVDPEHQKMGIGKLLWQFAKNSGEFGATLKVRSSLFAVPIYQRLGFECIGPPASFNGLHFQSMATLHP